MPFNVARATPPRSGRCRPMPAPRHCPRCAEGPPLSLPLLHAALTPPGPLPRRPFKMEPPPVGRFFSPPSPPHPFLLPLLRRTNNHPPRLCLWPQHPEAATDHRSRLPRRNIAAPSRLLRPIVALPPRCVPTGFALPGTSPSSCVSYPHRIPRTSSLDRMPPAAPARRRACSASCPSRSGQLAAGPHPRAMRL
jgi:hypothetical protein